MANNSSGRGFFRNAFDAVVAARQRQANEYVANLARIYGDDGFGIGAGRSSATSKRNSRA